jgi:hypothetical protein
MKHQIKQSNLAKNSLKLVAAMMAVGGLSADAQTVLYQDTFNVPNGAIGGATELSQLTGVNASSITPQSGGSGQVISGNQLSLTLGGGASTSEMRFGITGNPNTGAAPNLFDWSSGTGGADILSALGFTVSFNWTAGDTSSGNWIFFSVGNGGDISYSNLRILNSTTENGILLKNNGGVQIYNGGSGPVGSQPGFTPTSVNHLVTLTYNFSSWAANSAVTMTANVDGTAVGSTSFNWNATSGQYFDIGTYQNNNNLIDNFTVTTAPEPTTWAMMAGGFGMLFATRRFRRSEG